MKAPSFINDAVAILYRQTIFNQLNILVPVIGLCHNVTILWEIYVMRHKCYVRLHNFHFKRMIITGLKKKLCLLYFYISKSIVWILILYKRHFNNISDLVNLNRTDNNTMTCKPFPSNQAFGSVNLWKFVYMFYTQFWYNSPYD